MKFYTNTYLDNCKNSAEYQGKGHYFIRGPNSQSWLNCFHWTWKKRSW